MTDDRLVRLDLVLEIVNAAADAGSIVGYALVRTEKAIRALPADPVATAAGDLAEEIIPIAVQGSGGQRLICPSYRCAMRWVRGEHERHIEGCTFLAYRAAKAKREAGNA